MAKDVTIRVTATDQASPVFRTIGQTAAQTGQTIEQSNDRASQSAERFSVKAAALGAAIGATTGLLSNWTRAAADDEAQQARLQQAVENTGKSYDLYADAIDRAIKAGQDKAFSDEATRDALVSLNAVTNDTGASLNELGLAMDFARAKGISLQTSAEIIAKVYGGNIGILNRYGLQLDANATSEQALAKIQQISAGQAETYAETTAGALAKRKDQWDELTESIGAHTGSLQSLLLVIPGLTAAYTALGAAIGGVGGLSAIAGALGPLALVAGGASLAYGYSQDSIGTTSTNEFWNQFFLKSSQVINAALPGNPFNEKKYTDQMDQNAIGDILQQLLRAPGEDQSVIWDRIAKLTGDTTGEMSTKELINYIVTKAGAQGVSVDQYVGGLAASNNNFVLDPVTNTYMPIETYMRYASARAAAIPSTASSTRVPGNYGTPMYGTWTGGLPFGLGAMNAYQRGGGGAVANDLYNLPSNRAPVQALADSTNLVSSGATTSLVGANAAAQATANAEATRVQTEALVAQYGAYAGLVQGINSANDAQTAFKATQDGLLESENVYGQQISEYSGQLDAMSAAYDILNQRKQDGTALTQEETDFLNNYAEAQARGTAGVEDATVAQGLLAEQYLLNMEKGDAMNAALQGTTDATESLVVTIDRLILSMSGIPDEVRTAILLDLSDESISDLINYLNYLNSIPGSVSTVVETVYTSSSDGSGGRYRGAMNGITAYANGGTVYDPLMPRYAGGGTVAMVGERGPEMVWLPRGAQVSNTEATKSRMQAGNRQSRNTNFYGPVTLQMNTPDVYDALASSALGGAR